MAEESPNFDRMPAFCLKSSEGENKNKQKSKQTYENMQGKKGLARFSEVETEDLDSSRELRTLTITNVMNSFGFPLLRCQ